MATNEAIKFICKYCKKGGKSVLPRNFCEGTQCKEFYISQVRKTEPEGVQKCKCLRCGKIWTPRVLNPVACPGCKSSYWNRERVRLSMADARKIINAESQPQSEVVNIQPTEIALTPNLLGVDTKLLEEAAKVVWPNSPAETIDALSLLDEAFEKRTKK